MAKARPRYGFSGTQVNSMYLNFWSRNGLRENSTWPNFDEFLLWASKSGFRKGSHLRRVRTSVPYSPENCYWEYPDTAETVYPAGHPCGGCQAEPGCKVPCIKRAKYWNDSMKKLRPIFQAAMKKGG